MRFNPNFLVGIVYLVAGASAANAQEKSTAQIERAHVGAQVAPNDSSLGLGTVPKLELSTTQDKQKISLDWSLVSSESKRLPGTGIIENNFNQITLNVSTKLGEDEKTTEILNLKGFPNGTTVGLKWTHFWQQLRSGVDVNSVLDAVLETAISICEAHPRNRFLSVKEKGAECSADNGGEGYFVDLYNPEGFRRANRAQYVKNFTPFAGMSIDANQAKYSYFDKDAFKKNSDSKFSYEASLFAGLMLRDSPTIGRISFTVAEKYKEGDNITICQPVGTGSQIQCLEGPDGSPSIKEQRSISLDLIHAFAADELRSPQFGLAPRVSYDFKSKGYEASLPIYFVRNADRQLSGGIKFDYSNTPKKAGGRKEEFTAGLFIGVPLKF